LLVCLNRRLFVSINCNIGFVCLFFHVFCLFVCLIVLFVFLFVYMLVSVCFFCQTEFFVCLFVYLFVHLFVCLSIHLFVCLCPKQTLNLFNLKCDETNFSKILTIIFKSKTEFQIKKILFLFQK
jgi:hypothetical protein